MTRTSGPPWAFGALMLIVGLVAIGVVLQEQPLAYNSFRWVLESAGADFVAMMILGAFPMRYVQRLALVFGNLFIVLCLLAIVTGVAALGHHSAS